MCTSHAHAEGHTSELDAESAGRHGGHCSHERPALAALKERRERNEQETAVRELAAVERGRLHHDVVDSQTKLPASSVRSAQLHDVHSQFAQAYLRTPPERAVYFTLVAQLAESWSAAELASLKGRDVATVQAVLDRYVDAGIVATTGAGIELRYRWCAEMRYLFGAGEDTAIDPVCGMTTNSRSPHRLEDGFGTWHFCSSICLATFRANQSRH